MTRQPSAAKALARGPVDMVITDVRLPDGDGIATYDKAVQQLVFGAESSVVKEGRAVTVQSLGGTGSLRVGADFLRRFLPGAQVWISDPSWENHRALFEGAGFTVNTYAYFDPATRELRRNGSAAEREGSSSLEHLHQARLQGRAGDEVQGRV